MPNKQLDLANVRRTAITALFSDDVLTEYLVLKGGNALSLVYGITSRASIDLDFGMGQDFEDSEDAGRRVLSALHDRFDAVGYVVFDEKFEAVPVLKGPDEKPWWGGYEVSFKLIAREKYNSLRNDSTKLRNQALALGPGGKRPFRIDLSKCEFTDGKIESEIDHFKIYVYTPEMIAIEKLRAICQQMPEYPHTGNKKARARDFYDIYQVVTRRNLDLSDEENQTLLRHIFAAKQVPLSMLGNIARERDFHSQDWPSVVDTTAGELQGFEFYFDFVISQVSRLKALWVE